MGTNNRRRALLLACAAGTLASTAAAQSVVRDSVDGIGPAATQGNGASTQGQISNNGNSIVFRTNATSFSDGSSGQGATRIVRRNRVTGAITLISQSAQAAQPPLSGIIAQGGTNIRPSYRGGVTAYMNDADITDFCPDSNGFDDIYVDSGVPQPRSTADAAGCDTQGNGDSDNPSVSPDNSLIAFDTFATIFSAGDTATRDVYAVTATGAKSFSKKSVAGNPLSGIVAGNGDSSNPSITNNALGTFTAFESLATNLATNDSNNARDIFLRVEPSGVGFASTERISVATGGAQANGASFNPSVSANGNFVVFHSDAINLVTGDTNAALDVFIRDRVAGTTKRLSVSKEGVQANGSSTNAVVNDDGTWVAFESTATNLVTNFPTSAGRSHVYLCHVPTGSMFLCSFNYGTVSEGGANSTLPSISADGRTVAFQSDATNLQSVLADTNGLSDIYVYTLGATPGNDTCANASTLALGTVNGTTNGALPSVGLTIPSCANTADGPDVWYTFTAGCTGNYRFTTAGSAYDTSLAAFGSCGGTFIACNDDVAVGVLHSQLDLTLSAGQSIKLRVAGFRNRSGDFTLSASYLSSSPANDNCAQGLNLLIGDTAVATCGATTDAGQPDATCSFSPQSDVWYVFLPPQAGSYTVQTLANNFDTTLEVYSGLPCPVVAGNELGCNDDIATGITRSRVNFNTNGSPVKIRLGGFLGAQGTTTLRIGRTGCNLADVASVGDPGAPVAQGPDGQLTVDDLIIFVNDFTDSVGCPGFAPCNRADISEVGGTDVNPGTPDGQLTIDDIIVFVNLYSNGC